ncbi:TetR/AcrR family transcriptional regulator [Streptomyces sp. TP-A0356]|uniref:TetR/AcrR family transcriptional regulator n=1 Tax=Streptomyces sp. TP-A0356 TaxID=1359208 RepID=UPI0006E23B86|nr:TetR/AcrR family transcriptional regulator [Streptomyces sp. TP-A0356]
MRITEHGSAPHGRAAATAARRAQIIEAAIEVLAESGYVGTSFDVIAARASLSSKRLITYHFQTKERLYAAVLAEVFDRAARYMGPLIAEHSGYRAKFLAYIRSNLRFLAESPRDMRAVGEIVFNASAVVEGAQAASDTARERLVAAFREGQRAGEFRDFDPEVMATTVRCAIDGAGARFAEGADAAAYAEELVALFDRATRKAGDDE